MKTLSRLALLMLLLPSTVFAKVRVVSTTTTPAAIASAIGGDRLAVTSLSKGTQDPHYIDAKPSYVVEVSRADLLLVVGLDLEVGYLTPLLTGARNPKVLPGQPAHLDLSTLITPKEKIAASDRSQGDVHPSGNPHYWLDPENGRALARGIAARLSQLDPDGKDVYAAGLAAFEEALDAKEKDWEKRLAPLAGRKIVTYHRSWSYFADRYGLQVVGFVEPKPGIPPAPSHTLQLIKSMRNDGVKLILMENFYDARVPGLVAERAGAALVVAPNAVGGEAGIKTYFDLVERVVAEIEKAGG